MPKALERKQYYKASDLARLCEVDLKTIHNWADRGYLKAIRSPGRHIRIRRADMVSFLVSRSYDVPEFLRDEPAVSVPA